VYRAIDDVDRVRDTDIRAWLAADVLCRALQVAVLLLLQHKWLWRVPELVQWRNAFARGLRGAGREHCTGRGAGWPPGLVRLRAQQLLLR
jgi:hypothetical protein